MATFKNAQLGIKKSKYIAFLSDIYNPTVETSEGKKLIDEFLK